MLRIRFYLICSQLNSGVRWPHASLPMRDAHI